ncbi:hypothetical protein AgCh_032961 [Apium graveolens]
MFNRPSIAEKSPSIRPDDIIVVNCHSVPEAPVPGMRNEVTEGDEYQDTVPFDDIIIADSPFSETELESIMLLLRF